MKSSKKKKFSRELTTEIMVTHFCNAMDWCVKEIELLKKQREEDKRIKK